MKKASSMKGTDIRNSLPRCTRLIDKTRQDKSSMKKSAWKSGKVVSTVASHVGVGSAVRTAFCKFFAIQIQLQVQVQRTTPFDLTSAAISFTFPPAEFSAGFAAGLAVVIGSIQLSQLLALALEVLIGELRVYVI